MADPVLCEKDGVVTRAEETFAMMPSEADVQTALSLGVSYDQEEDAGAED